MSIRYSWHILKLCIEKYLRKTKKKLYWITNSIFCRKCFKLTFPFLSSHWSPAHLLCMLSDKIFYTNCKGNAGIFGNAWKFLYFWLNVKKILPVCIYPPYIQYPNIWILLYLSYCIPILIITTLLRPISSYLNIFANKLLNRNNRMFEK